MSGAPKLIAALIGVVLAIGLVACGGGDESASDSEPTVGQLTVSGGGSGPFHEPGGDNSVQNFGNEASKSELTQAATSLHSYLVARAEKEWELACSYLSKKITQGQGQPAGRSSQVKTDPCPSALAAGSVGTPRAASLELTEIDARSLRTGRELTFLLYYGAHKTPYYTLMTKEGGSWKVDELSPTAF